MIQRERIVTTALELARSEGAAALSIRRLAEACSIDPRIVYRHFVDKDGLLLAVYDRMQMMSLERISDLPPDADWREVLRRLAESVWEVHTTYPAIAALTFARTTGSPAESQGAELILSMLLRAGLDTRDAVLYYRSFVDTMLSLAGMEAVDRASPPEIRALSTSAWRQVHANLLRSHAEDANAQTPGSGVSSHEVYLTSLEAILERIAMLGRREHGA